MTHIATIDAPLLDEEHLATLQMIAEGDAKGFILELFETYRGEWDKNLDGVKEHAKAKNNSELRKAVHLIAGSSSNMGFRRLGSLCKAIEVQIDEEKFEDYEEIAGLIEKEYQATAEAMEDFLKKL